MLSVSLTITSEATGLPVKSIIRLRYETGQYFEPEKHTFELGTTNDNGETKVYTTIPDGARNVDLVISGMSYYSPPFMEGSAWIKNVPLNKDKHYNIALKPYYYFSLSMSNVNCYNATDTASVDGYNRLNIGCGDTTFQVNPSYNWSSFSESPNIIFGITVKRNNVTSYVEQSFTLQEGSITPVHIDY